MLQCVWRLTEEWINVRWSTKQTCIKIHMYSYWVDYMLILPLLNCRALFWNQQWTLLDLIPRSYIVEHCLTDDPTMERVTFNDSTKNIPVASDKEYIKQFIDKTEQFLRRMRWKAFHFLNQEKSTAKETFGFKTKNCPPVIEELRKFEGHDPNYPKGQIPEDQLWVSKWPKEWHYIG